MKQGLIIFILFFAAKLNAQLSVSPAFLDFGIVSPGDTFPIARELKLKNTATDDTIIIYGIRPKTTHSLFGVGPTAQIQPPEGDTLLTKGFIEKLTLAPGQETRLKVWLKNAGRHAESMVINERLLLPFELVHIRQPGAKAMIDREIPLTVTTNCAVAWSCTSYDFGALYQGDTAVGKYYCHNLTSKQLVWEAIYDTAALTVSYPRKLGPYANDSVVVKINTENTKGSCKGGFTIKTQEPYDFPMYQLKYTACVAQIKKYPLAEFDNDVLYQDVSKKDSIKFVFKFRNIGSVPLQIHNCRRESMNISIDWPRNPVLPGDTAAIEICYCASDKPGYFDNTIKVNSNDRFCPGRVLHIAGTVR